MKSGDGNGLGQVHPDNDGLYDFWLWPWVLQIRLDPYLISENYYDVGNTYWLQTSQEWE